MSLVRTDSHRQQRKDSGWPRNSEFYLTKTSKPKMGSCCRETICHCVFDVLRLWRASGSHGLTLGSEVLFLVFLAISYRLGSRCRKPNRFVCPIEQALRANKTSCEGALVQNHVTKSCPTGLLSNSLRGWSLVTREQFLLCSWQRILAKTQTGFYTNATNLIHPHETYWTPADLGCGEIGETTCLWGLVLEYDEHP